MTENDKKLCDGCIGKLPSRHFKHIKLTPPPDKDEYLCSFAGPRNDYQSCFIKNGKCEWFYPIRKLFPLRYKIQELINSFSIEFGFLLDIETLQKDLFFVKVNNIIGGEYKNGHYYLRGIKLSKQ